MENNLFERTFFRLGCSISHLKTIFLVFLIVKSQERIASSSASSASWRSSLDVESHSNGLFTIHGRHLKSDERSKAVARGSYSFAPLCSLLTPRLFICLHCLIARLLLGGLASTAGESFCYQLSRAGKSRRKTLAPTRWGRRRASFFNPDNFEQTFWILFNF